MSQKVWYDNDYITLLRELLGELVCQKWPIGMTVDMNILEISIDLIWATEYVV